MDPRPFSRSATPRHVMQSPRWAAPSPSSWPSWKGPSLAIRGLEPVGKQKPTRPASATSAQLGHLQKINKPTGPKGSRATGVAIDGHEVGAAAVCSVDFSRSSSISTYYAESWWPEDPMQPQPPAGSLPRGRRYSQPKPAEVAAASRRRAASARATSRGTCGGGGVSVPGKMPAESPGQLIQMLPITDEARKAWPIGTPGPPLADLAVEERPWQVLDLEGSERARMPRREAAIRFVREEGATDDRREAFHVFLPERVAGHAAARSRGAARPCSARTACSAHVTAVPRPFSARPEVRAAVSGASAEKLRTEPSLDTTPGVSSPATTRKRPPAAAPNPPATPEAQPTASSRELPRTPRPDSSTGGQASPPTPRQRPQSDAATAPSPRSAGIGPLPAAALLSPELCTFMLSGSQDLDKSQLLTAYEAAGGLTARRRVEVRIGLLRIVPELRTQLERRSEEARRLKRESQQLNFLAVNRAESLRWQDRKLEIEQERMVKRQEWLDRFCEWRLGQQAEQTRPVVTLQQKNRYRRTRRVLELKDALARFRDFVMQWRLAGLQAVTVHGAVASQIGLFLRLGRRIREIRSNSRYTRAAQILTRRAHIFISSAHSARLDKAAATIQRICKMFLWRSYVARRRASANIITRQLEVWGGISTWHLVAIRIMARVRLVQRHVRRLVFVRQAALELLSLQWDRAESTYLLGEHHALTARQNQVALGSSAFSSAGATLGRPVLPPAADADALQEGQPDGLPAGGTGRTPVLARHVRRDVKLAALVELRSMVLRDYFKAVNKWEWQVLTRVVEHPLHVLNFPPAATARIMAMEPFRALSIVSTTSYSFARLLKEPLERSPARRQLDRHRRVQSATRNRLRMGARDGQEGAAESTEETKDHAGADPETEPGEMAHGADLLYSVVKWCPPPRRQYVAPSLLVTSAYASAREWCEFSDAWETRGIDIALLGGSDGLTK